MKKLVLFVVVALAVACEQDKIAYVDNVKLMDGYQERIDVEAKFKTKVDALTKKRDSIGQAFQIEIQAFQAKAQSMAPDKAQEQYGQIQQRGQFMGQQLQQEEQQIQAAGQIEMDTLVSQVKKQIQAYGKANGYTYILGGGDGGGVLYGAEAKDLTEEILKVLNKDYKK